MLSTSIASAATAAVEPHLVAEAKKIQKRQQIQMQRRWLFTPTRTTEMLREIRHIWNMLAAERARYTDTEKLAYEYVCEMQFKCECVCAAIAHADLHGALSLMDAERFGTQQLRACMSQWPYDAFLVAHQNRTAISQHLFRLIAHIRALLDDCSYIDVYGHDLRRYTQFICEQFEAFRTIFDYSTTRHNSRQHYACLCDRCFHNIRQIYNDHRAAATAEAAVVARRQLQQQFARPLPVTRHHP